MKHLKLFAALCCAAAAFAACDKTDEPNAKQSNDHDTKNDTKEAVDLGVSVKWATCNVGATAPEEYGNYYAWGETDTKKTYSWDDYRYGFSREELTKYNTAGYSRNSPSVDNKTVLEPADDVATQNWNEAWRTPTKDEWTELREQCDWKRTTLKGVKGYEVKGKNGNSIFLPAAGYYYGQMPYNANYGYYWSSSLCADSPYGAWNIYFSSDFSYMVNYFRVYGLSVRPVQE